eukprot:gnl/MRDRNA2_/MRDRNA2_67587_c0_seq2.p1 gnl/MRDRNA2_/MRDRNA2_67587_c0~~gnl/MRDRNA2_/MRDRNA2_67587_c0_seq2.p1  ORF type:complete len:924 (+),score=135.44 gnl/MRDRNA2_/MRDRNA2_67587_c0_seq2:57-2828(+)
MGVRGIEEFKPVVIPAAGADRNAFANARSHPFDGSPRSGLNPADQFQAQRAQAEEEHQQRLDESLRKADALVSSRSSAPWPQASKNNRRSSRCRSPAEGGGNGGKMNGLTKWLPMGSWLPKNWVHCPPDRYWTTKHEPSPRKAKSYTKSCDFDCSSALPVTLWPPLDEIVEAMPARSRPSQGTLRAVSQEANQHQAFAKLVSGTMHVRALCEPPCWFEKRAALALPGLGATAAAPLVNAPEFASACALHHDSCKVLLLGAAEPACSKLVSVFRKVKHLNASWLPEALPDGLETLSLALPHGMKFDMRTIRKRPSNLQELSIHGLSPVKAVGRFIEQMESLSWVDLALWEKHPPAEELLPAAASVVQNGGLLTWPNSFVFDEAVGFAGIGLVELKKIQHAASSAATRKLQEVVWDAERTLLTSRTKLVDSTTDTGPPMASPSNRRCSMAAAPTKVATDRTWRAQFKDHAAQLEVAAFHVASPKQKKSTNSLSPLGEASKTLAEIIRYAKEFRVNYEHTERAQGLLLRLALERLELEDPKNSQSKVKKRSVAMVKSSNVQVRGGINHIDAIQALVNLGFSRTHAADLFDYVDCEQKGYLNAGDWRSAIRAGAPAGIPELRALHDFMTKRFRTLEHAYKNFDEDGTGELSKDEFQQGLERLGWNQVSQDVRDTPTHSKGYAHKRGDYQALFALLDGARRSGMVGMEEFSLLACFASLHAMTCIEGIAQFMIGKFGTLEAAYRCLDRDRSGTVSPDELGTFLRESGCVDHECVNDAFNFIDRDCNGYLTRREIVALQGFSTRAFLKDVRLLRDQMIASYGSLEAAFNFIDASDAKDKEISLQEFLDAWSRMDANKYAKLDPRLLYHFLDTSHDGSVSLREWLRLRCFNPDAAQENVRLSWDDLIQKLGRDPHKIITKLFELAAKPPT